MRWFFIFVIFFFSGFCLAQEFEVLIANVTDEKGIDVPATFGITQDNYGFIWFGTVDGLYRYDGNQMKIYRNVPEDTNSLSNNTIRAIVSDTIRNVLWIGTQGGGLNSFDLLTGKFTRYENNPDSINCLSNNSVWQLMLDKEADLWIGMENNQLNKFNPDKALFTSIDFEQDVEVNAGTCAIRMLYNDREGNVWVGTDNNGLYKLNDGIVKEHYSAGINNAREWEHNFVLCANEDEEYIRVATYGGGVVAINKATGSIEHIKSSADKLSGPISNLTYALLGGDDNKIWVGTEYGLSLIDKTTLKANHYVKSGSLINDLTDNRIRILFKDAQGIIWIGTEAGVDKVILQDNFKIYRNVPNNPHSFPSGIVRSILKDSEGVLWVGLIDKGLIKYDNKNNEYINFSQRLAARNDLVCYQVSALFEDSNGILWIGDWENGLLKFDRKTETFIPILNHLTGDVKLSDSRIQVIKEAEPGVLWIGTETGIHRYNYKEQKIDYIQNIPDNDNSISGNSIQSAAFEIDENGNLWVGTWSKGLNYIEIVNKEPFKYHVKRYLQPTNKQWLNNSNVISLFLENDSLLWIGTFGGGLVKFDIKTNVFSSYDSQDGLPNNTIFAIAKGVGNTLWLSTDFGLSNFDTQNISFHNYEKGDGLQDNHFFWGATYTALDGEQFFGGIGGLNSFIPDRISNKITPNKIYVTDFVINNQVSINPHTIELTDKIELSYKENYLSIGFAILDYINTTDNVVEVKLSGLDEDWYKVGNQRSVNYSSLLPGKYLFKIRTANSDGSQSFEKTLLQIYIQPPWWKVPWVRVVQVFLLLLILFGIYKVRINVLIGQKRKLTQMVRERTSEILQKNMVLGQQNEEIRVQKEELASKNEELNSTLDKLSEAKEKVIQAEKMASIGVLAAGVAHEINNPLNFIKGGLMGIEEHFLESDCGKTHEPKLFLKAIKEGVERTSAIISSLNQFGRMSDNNKDHCAIHDIIENCLVVLGHQLKDRVEVQMNLFKDPVIILGNSGKLHQVLLNVLSNAEQAISDKGIIDVSTFVKDGYVEVLISDTGIGINKEDIHRVIEPFFTTKDPGKGTGLGLSVGYKIIKEHNGEMTFKSIKGKGTTVIIKLPLVS